MSQWRLTDMAPDCRVDDTIMNYQKPYHDSPKCTETGRYLSRYQVFSERTHVHSEA